MKINLRKIKDVATWCFLFTAVFFLSFVYVGGIKYQTYVEASEFDWEDFYRTHRGSFSVRVYTEAELENLIRQYNFAFNVAAVLFVATLVLAVVVRLTKEEPPIEPPFLDRTLEDPFAG